MRPLPVDTDLVVAGLIGGDHTAPPAIQLDAMPRGALPFLLSIDVPAESRAVLLSSDRPLREPPAARGRALSPARAAAGPS